MAWNRRSVLLSSCAVISGSTGCLCNGVPLQSSTGQNSCLELADLEEYDVSNIEVQGLNNSWPMEGYDNKNSYRMSNPSPSLKYKGWIFERSAISDVSPIIGYDTVFFGTEEGLHALNVSTGEERWSRFYDYNITATPAISGNLVTFGLSNGLIITINATTGENKWEEPLSITPDGGITATDNAIAIVGREDDLGKIQVLDPDSGARLWSTLTETRITRSAAMTENILVVVTSAGRVRAFEISSGDEIWEFSRTTMANSHCTAPAIHNENVYYLTRTPSKESDSVLYALDIVSGGEHWSVSISGPNIPGNLAVSEDAVYVMAESGKPANSDSSNLRIETTLASLDRRGGGIIWNKQISGSVWAGPIIADDNIITVIGDAFSTHHRSNGDVDTCIELPAPPTGGIAVAGGLGLIGGINDSLYAIG